MSTLLTVLVLAAIGGVAVYWFRKNVAYGGTVKETFEELVLQDEIQKAAKEVKSTADINKDGRVDLKDAAEGVKKVKAAAKKSVAKAEVAAKRVRKGGKFVGDDKSTPDVNEAFKDGKAPAKKTTKKTTKKYAYVFCV